MDTKVDNQYIFIGGTGRSGTNITRNILANHSQVASFPFEYRFIIDPDGIIDFYHSMSNAWSPFMADIKIKRLHHFLMNLANRTTKKNNYIDWELSKWFPEYIHNVEKLISELYSFKYSGFWPGAKGDNSNYNIWFSNYRNKKELGKILGQFIKNNIDQFLIENGKIHFIEDNTWNILFAIEIKELIPKAKLIHIIRDPRDVVASFMKQKWCPHDCKQAVQMYKEIIVRWFNIEKTLSNNYFMYIKLEDLVSKQEDVIKSICDFSKIPFESSLTKIDLSKSNHGRWKKELSRIEKNIVENELSDIIQRFGYHIS